MIPTAGLPHAGAVSLACGLGNPGAEYAATRHNAGAWCVARLAADAGVRLAAVAKLPAVAARGTDGVRLMAPTTYMNDSGRALAALARYFKVEPASVLVIHDEIDLAPGMARFKFGGGHAGHNGLRDIIAVLATRDFWRLRIGVGHPRQLARQDSSDSAHPPEVVDWVLGRPAAAERAAIELAIDAVAASWPAVAAGAMDVAMAAVHKVQGG